MYFSFADVDLDDEYTGTYIDLAKLKYSTDIKDANM